MPSSALVCQMTESVHVSIPTYSTVQRRSWWVELLQAINKICIHAVITSKINSMDQLAQSKQAEKQTQNKINNNQQQQIKNKHSHFTC